MLSWHLAWVVSSYYGIPGHIEIPKVWFSIPSKMQILLFLLNWYRDAVLRWCIVVHSTRHQSATTTTTRTSSLFSPLMCRWNVRKVWKNRHRPSLADIWSLNYCSNKHQGVENIGPNQRYWVYYHICQRNAWDSHIWGVGTSKCLAFYLKNSLKQLFDYWNSCWWIFCCKRTLSALRINVVNTTLHCKI